MPRFAGQMPHIAGYLKMKIMSKTKQNKAVVPLDNRSMVREANELIEAKYILDTWEARIFHSAISQIKPSDVDFQKYKVYIKDIETKYGIKDKDMYRRIRDAAKSLRGKEIIIPYRYDEGMGHLVTGLITSYGGLDDSDGAFVMIELHPDLKPYLLMLKKRFTQYNLLFLMKMQSRYSRRIYKLLKQYQTIGKRKFTIERLRELLCIEDGVYAKYSHFKRRVVLKAQEDLEEMTDIRFTFDEHKRGRSVAALTFYIIPNNPQSVADSPAKPLVIEVPAKRGISNQPAIRGISHDEAEQMRIWRVSKKSIESWINEFGVEQVAKAVAYTKKATEKGEIKNPAGYLNKIVRQTELGAQETEAKKAKAEKSRKAAELKAQKAALADAEKAARRENYDSKIRLVRKILTENPIIQTQVFEQVKRKYARLFEPGMTDMQCYDADGTTIRPKVNQIIFDKFSDMFAPIDKEMQGKIKAIEGKRRRLGA